MNKASIAFVGDILTEPICNNITFPQNFEISIKHYNIDSNMEVFLTNQKHTLIISHLTSRFSSFSKKDQIWEENLIQYIEAIKDYLSNNNTFVFLNTLPKPNKLFCEDDYFSEVLKINALNEKIIKLSKTTNLVSILDVDLIISRLGYQNAISLNNDLIMRMPYKKAMVKQLGYEYQRLINQRLCPRKKLIIVDADNTLWNGIVGEDGINKISIGTEYPGSLFIEFQKILKAASNSGILLGLVSKNDHDDVISAFKELDMPLKITDFVQTQINWKNKSENITLIANELDLGLDSIVFVDDSDYEINQVESSLPDVECYQFDHRVINKSLELLQAIHSLSSWSITSEDKNKKQQYIDNFERKKQLNSALSFDSYLESLNINIYYGINRKNYVQRISQLTNKTNQFNLTTKRYSEADILELMNKHKVYDFTVKDKFGDMGIVGLAIIKGDTLDTFLLSCRALGRYIEDDLLNFITSANNGLLNLKATYINSGRNNIADGFLTKNRFSLVMHNGNTKCYQLTNKAKIELKYNFKKI